jgi:TatD DNase family protein
MALKIIDAHTHVQFEQYDKDRDDVIARAIAAGVGMINAGADLKSSKDAVDLAHKYENGVWAAVGVHPTEIRTYTDRNADKNGFISDNPSGNLLESAMREIETLAHDEKVVGIGECGLDLHSLIDSDRSSDKHRYIGGNPSLNQRQSEILRQKEIFEKHIRLSGSVKKPLVIHCREAFGDTIDILTDMKNELLPEPGILHFFTGTVENARQLLALNFSFTFGGLITFNRSFDDILKFIPLEKILVETDAPFVTPIPYRGKRNEPAYVVSTVEALAKIKGIPSENVSEATLKNTIRVFNLSI